MARISCIFLAAFVSVRIWSSPLTAAEPGRVDVEVREKGQLVPCRIHLYDAEGKTPKIPRWPAWNDHIVCDAGAQLEIPAGEYRYEIERGPEFTSVSGKLTVAAGTPTKIAADIARIADLKSEGWWSGELHVHRPVDDVPLLMKSEDLHVSPVITWWNKRNVWSDRAPPAELLVRFDGNRFYHVMGGEDEREGGALLYFGLVAPIAIADADREYPSPMRFLDQARRHAGVHVDIEKPFWWDVPAWLASGQVDTVGIANNHMARSKMYPGEAWGKPRDDKRLPSPAGNGYWTQELYYHILNCGLRIAPSAGSASGVLPNPVGYNRVYVHLDGDLTHDRWFDGLRAGRSFVTNGPLLRVRAAGQYPGHVFTSPDQIEIELSGVLEGRDRVDSLEIIRDGRVEKKVPTAEFTKSGTLGKLKFTSSGWFLVRVIADNPQTFRFASAAPWYVEVGPVTRRVSRASAQFFRDWTDERIGRVKVADPLQKAEVLEPHYRARDYWSALVEKANAD
ncbi:MAG: CehA/McbA family metallohydrolase [Planctomycetia bacterium]|nr:CehA/McbA family metallohydrolase [Planctomycetia bacterium]